MDELIIKPIEDATGTLSGVSGITSMAAENMGMVMLQYDYDKDIDEAYDDLKKKVDNLDLPDDASTPMIMEMNMNDMPSISLAVNNDSQENLYNYVNDKIVPEFEKLSNVASVSVAGGHEEYIKVELIPEKLDQYHLTMNSIVSAISSADLTFPVGSTDVGHQTLSVTAGVDYDTVESLNNIPINLGGNNIIYLSDVANIYPKLEEADSIGRYNGRDTIALTITKQQGSTDVEVSSSVKSVMTQLMAADPDLEIIVVTDMSETITNSLTSVVQTMILAIFAAMFIIWLFFGEIKASLIVGTSIPISIFVALIGMNLMGFSMNIITMSSLVLGVGMMVDNSIVVLESCFRASEKMSTAGLKDYANEALFGTNNVIASIIGSTMTTCVVFIPLATISGMAGQMFRPLGFSIVFCMCASLLSAMTIVPLCYTVYKPVEKDHAPLSRPIAFMQRGYRRIMKVLMPRRGLVILASVVLLILSFMLAGQLGFELINTGEGDNVAVSIEIRSGMDIEKVDEIVQKVEAVISADEDIDSYMTSYGASGLSMSTGNTATVTAYLKDDTKTKAADLVDRWKPILTLIPDCDITLEASSLMSLSMLSSGTSYEVELESTQYDSLKEASDKIVNELVARPEVTRVHSSLENAAPVVKIDIDPIASTAEGLTPTQVASTVYMMLSGTEATTLTVDGDDMSVMVEYPDDEYVTLNQLEGIVLTSTTGASVPLTDIATIGFQDTPAAIMRSDKQYQVTITADYTEYVDVDNDREVSAVETRLDNEVVRALMGPDVSIAQSALNQAMAENLGSLFQAVFTAIFLIFVVMAGQFESMRFSVMVMTTIPFAMIGSFGFLFLANCKISMPSMLGFIMLIGTVVNSGILFVNTANQNRETMETDDAVIEAGAIRMRPILMTTLTTIIAMIPMCAGFGQAGAMLQGLALVDVGGLVASTFLSMFMLPAYYSVMSKKKKKEDEEVLPDPD